jgi:hypothetical protein
MQLRPGPLLTFKRTHLPVTGLVLRVWEEWHDHIFDVTIEFFLVHAAFLVHPDAAGPLSDLVVAKLLDSSFCHLANTRVLA